LLFKHFPTKSALYAEILAEECNTDPGLNKLLGLPPSTETLVTLIRGMIRHFMQIPGAPDQEDEQRMRLMIISHLNDGEFARVLFEKVGALIGPAFTSALEQAISAGDASRVGAQPLNLFWFAHHTAMMAALTQLAAEPTLPVIDSAARERQLCEFVLRGIGLQETVIASHMDRELPLDLTPRVTTESA
jgi:AcrR family transcriptional regulator